MTDLEARILRQENQILKLRAELAEARKRNTDLQRMHDADQRWITKLQGQLKAKTKTEAERVFGGQ